jgi:5-methyltetrahydrofolate--homocysteine methyltransferase
MLKRIIDEKRYTAKAVIGFWPANSPSATASRSTPTNRARRADQRSRPSTFLRQQNEKPAGQFNHCLADFIAPKGAAASTISAALPSLPATASMNSPPSSAPKHDDFNAILAQALGDRLAEALAELMHKKARDFSGYGKTENLEMKDIIREKYRGVRPAPGYPACPDHTSQAAALCAARRDQPTGITLTESNAMHPASSVSGWYFNHPDSKYFATGKLGERPGRGLRRPHRPARHRIREVVSSLSRLLTTDRHR